MANYEFCGYCRYCVCDNASNDIRNGKFHCNRENIWVFADGTPVKSNCFWQVHDYNLSDRDSAMKASKKYRGYYIITAIFNKLGLNNSKELETLYKYKNYFINKNCDSLCSDYDIFGPRIAKLIEVTDIDGSLSKSLYDFYVVGMLKSIKNGKLIDTKELFETMYVRLKNKFIIEPMMAKDGMKQNTKQKPKTLVLRKLD